MSATVGVLDFMNPPAFARAAKAEGGIALSLLRKEPAVVISVIGATLSLAAALGLSLTPAQTGGIMSIVQVMVWVVVRSQVIPAKAPPFPPPQEDAP